MKPADEQPQQNLREMRVPEADDFLKEPRPKVTRRDPTDEELQARLAARRTQVLSEVG